MMQRSPLHSVLEAYALAVPSMQQEFKQLQLGALYFLGIEQSAHAIKLAGQTLASVGPTAKAVLLAQSPIELDEVLSYLSKPDSGPANLQSYQFKTASLQALQQLPKQMDRALKPVKRLIVLLLPINEIALWQINASSLLKQWRNWAENNACTLLIIAYGVNAKLLAHELYTENNSLSGLAVMSAAPERGADELNYEIQHWRSHLGVKGSESLKLRATDRFFELMLARKNKDQAQTVPQTATARKITIIFERSVLEGAPISMAENWQVVDSWAELIEKGLAIISPILVFALNSSEDVEDLARILYRLRLQRAGAVKLVVREMHHALRKQEVNLLNSCGASLVVPEGTQLARFFSLLETVKKQPSIYQLTENLEQAIAIVKPQQVRGTLTAAAFCDYVEQLFSNMPMDGFAGVLVALRPVPMLSAEMVLSQIQLTRMGDVACAANNVVYIFLFGCRPNFATLALQRVFKLPFSELIIEDQVYEERAAIEEQVLRIRKSRHTAKPRVLTKASVHRDEDKGKTQLSRPLFRPILQSLR